MTDPTPNSIPGSQTLTLPTKLAYGVGQIADGTKTAAFSTFLFFYYNQVLGLSGKLAGLAALLALIVDAFTDPMIGQYSDRFRSRFGRRHPFMFAGSIPFALALWLLFSPPAGLSQTALFAWMLGGAVFVRLLLTLFFVPHLSLGAEMVRDYHQRTELISYRMVATTVGVILTSIVGFAVFFPSTPEFENGMLNGENYPMFGLCAGLFASLAMLISVFGTRKTIPHLSEPIVDPSARSAMLGFITVFETLKLHSFRILFFTLLPYMVISGVTLTFTVYYGSFLLGFDSQDMAALAAAIFIGIVSAPKLAMFVSTRFDKKGALSFLIVCAATIGGTPLCLYLLGVYQSLGSSGGFALVFVCQGISQAFFIAYTIVLDSMISDSIDEHELETHRREEGVFFAARALATKASYGLGSFCAGVALDIIEFPQDAAPGEVDQATLDALAFVGGPLVIVFYISTVLISRRYRLNAERHAEVMRALGQR